MSRFILALDQGTTSSRSVLFDQSGRIVAMAQREFAQHFPQPGWVEHDPQDIWSSQCATIAEVLAKAGASPRDLAAAGIANQRETALLWDRATGEPLMHAIVWQDRRTAPLCERLRVAGHEPRVAQLTGLLLDPYFSGTKLAWMLDTIPGARERAARGELAFGTVDSWLVWKLTGGRHHITDVTNASRTLLLNLHTVDWDSEMLALLDIPRECLPRIVDSSLSTADAIPVEIAGHTVPLAGIAGDQQAALFGQTCFKPGTAKNTYGTGCFLLMNTGAQPLPSNNRLLTTVGWRRTDTVYALEGGVFVAGAVVQWLRDGLGIIRRSEDVEALASSVDDNGGVHFVPAFAGLGAPHWDPHARGMITGLSRGSTAAHIARAALESIAFQSAELLQAMEADAGQPLIELRVDGGATVNNLLMQFQADLLGVPVVRPEVTETTALGAAYLAGLGVGFWKSESELERKWKSERRFDPGMGRGEAVGRMSDWREAVSRTRLPA